MGGIWSRAMPPPPPAGSLSEVGATIGGIWSRAMPPPPQLLPPPPTPTPVFLQTVRKLLAQTTPGGSLVTEQLAMLLGSYTPVVLSLAPCIYMLYTGNIDTVGIYFSEASMYVGMGNSFTWLFYNTILMRKRPAVHEVLGNGLVLVANFQNLMIICTAKGLRKRGYNAGACLCVGLLVVLSLLIWVPTNLPSLVILILGGIGILTSFVSHLTQIIDIVWSPSNRMTRVCTAINLVPTLVSNLASFIITNVWHHEDMVAQAVSGLGMLCNVLEIVILLVFRGPDMDTPRDTSNEHVLGLHMDTPRDTSNEHVSIPIPGQEDNGEDDEKKEEKREKKEELLQEPLTPFGSFLDGSAAFQFPTFVFKTPEAGLPRATNSVPTPATFPAKGSKKRPKTDPTQKRPKTVPTQKPPVETQKPPVETPSSLCSPRLRWRRLFSSTKKKAST